MSSEIHRLCPIPTAWKLSKLHFETATHSERPDEDFKVWVCSFSQAYYIGTVPAAHEWFLEVLTSTAPVQFLQFPSYYGAEMKPLQRQKFSFSTHLSLRAQAICRQCHTEHILDCWAKAKLEPRAGTKDRISQV